MTGGSEHESACPCLVTRDELDHKLALCRADCALHRQKAVALIDKARHEICEDTCEDTESALDKAVSGLREEIMKEIKVLKEGQDTIKASQTKADEEHRDFYKNVIYVLLGMLATIGIGFMSIFWGTGGVL